MTCKGCAYCRQVLTPQSLRGWGLAAWKREPTLSLCTMQQQIERSREDARAARYVRTYVHISEAYTREKPN